LYYIGRTNSQIEATDGTARPVILDAPLAQQLQQYFNAIGTANTHGIYVRDLYGEFLVVEFDFYLAAGHWKGIMFSTDVEFQGEWDASVRLDTDWVIYEYDMGPPIGPPEPRWWEKLPNWLQGILRYVFFGWIWMK